MQRIYFFDLFNDLLESQIKQLEDTFSFKMYTSQPGVPMEGQIRWAEREQMDAIVCLWENYEEVLQCNPALPVYPIWNVCFNVCVILYLLKKYLREHGLEHYKKVLLGTNLPINVEIKLLEEMFGLEIANPPWKDDLTQAELDAYARQGFQVVVCNPRYIERIKKSGMLPFHDKTAIQYMNLYQEMHQITEYVAMSARLQRTMDELQIMLNYSFEAMCILDSGGAVNAYNEKALELFDCPGDQSIKGSRFCQLVPAVEEADLTNVLEKKKPIYGRIITTSRAIGMLNITPCSMRDNTVGAVVHFTTIQQIENMESQVKSEFYKKGHYAKYTFADILGDSPVMVRTKKLADRFSKYNSNVLLYGESGCGKELFAQSIHNASLRANQPFVALNCGSLPENLLESELFGYVEGAFTGALKKGKKGMFEIANKGTIFLDEISEMGPEGQIRLLRVLEERCVMRIGDDKLIPIDVRVIAASNKKLVNLIKEGKFRADLYYRLNVLTLNIPPLRERGEDIIRIANRYIEKYSKEYLRKISLSPEAERLLLQYPWEGNVRQLRNFCERLVIVADGMCVSAAEMQEHLDLTDMPVRAEALRQPPAPQAPVMEDLEAGEKRNLLLALEQNNGNRAKTATMLGISKATLWRKMKHFGIL